MQNLRPTKLSVFFGLGLFIALSILSGPSFAGDYDQQIKELKGIIGRHPDDVDSMYHLGKYLAWDSRHDEAVKVYEQLLGKWPDHKDAQLGLAKAYGWKGDHPRAIRQFKRFILKYPDNHEAQQGIASVYLWIGDFENSIEYFKRALTLKPNDVYDLKGIGRAYLGRGDRKTAEDYFTKAQIRELRKTPLATVILYTVFALMGGGVVLYVFRRWAFQRKKEILLLELKVIRASLTLYYQKTGKYPLSLEILTQEKFRPPGEAAERTFLEGVRRGARGYLVDSFKSRYYYNPDTGGVRCTVKGCENL